MRIEFLSYQNDFIGATEPEIIMGGGYGSGKSWSLCVKVVMLLKRYPKNRGFLCRKTLQSLKTSTLKTLLDGDGDLPPALPKELIAYHNKQDRVIRLHNKSELFYGNMDIEMIKSMNLGFAAVDEASELSEEEWNALIGRLRLSGVPTRQIFGVTNPASDKHWIYNRFAVNPKIDQNKNLIQKFIKVSTLENRYLPESYVQNLKNTLFGHFFQRYVLGEWVGADKLVYDNFNYDTHVIPNFTIPLTWKKYRSIDFGYKSPFSCCWFAVADNDLPQYNIKKNDVILYREIYYTERTTSVNADRVIEFSRGEEYVTTISDWDSGDRADLESRGIKTVKANKDILFNIQKVRERLGNIDINKGQKIEPRFFIFQNTLAEIDPKIRQNILTGEMNNDPTCAKEEFMAYGWKRLRTGELKEEPEDKFNHAMDAIQYFFAYIDGSQIWKNIEFMKL